MHMSECLRTKTTRSHHNAPGEGRLLRRFELAAALGCSCEQVSRLTRAGMPAVYIGERRGGERGASPRYDLEKVKAWLEARSARKGVVA